MVAAGPAAAMHGDHHGAGRFGGTGQLHGVAVVRVHPGAHLDGDRHRHGTDHRLDDPHGQRLVAHQGGAGKHVADLLDRTAHVDVDDLRTALHVEAGGLGHHGRICPGDLHGLRFHFAGMVDAAGRLDAVPELRVGRRHFRYRITGPQPLAQLAVRPVGHAGHGGHQCTVRQRIRADVQRRGLAGCRVGGQGRHDAGRGTQRACRRKRAKARRRRGDGRPERAGRPLWAAGLPRASSRRGRDDTASAAAGLRAG